MVRPTPNKTAALALVAQLYATMKNIANTSKEEDDEILDFFFLSISRS
jgi:hypothetical protein